MPLTNKYNKSQKITNQNAKLPSFHPLELLDRIPVHSLLSSLGYARIL